MKTRGRWVLGCALMFVALVARAELWAYVDARGVAHITSRALDSRYSLVHRSVAGGEIETRVPGKAQDPQSLITWLEIAPQAKALQPLLREASRLHGVDADLLKAVIAVESGFDPRAVSPRGALGLMQITPDSAQRYATATERGRPVEERMMDVHTNVMTGARMLADLMRRFATVDLALAAWNAGEGTVRRAGGAFPAIEETRAHVHLVLELYWALLQRRLTLQAHTLSVQLTP